MQTVMRVLNWFEELMIKFRNKSVDVKYLSDKWFSALSKSCYSHILLFSYLGFIFDKHLTLSNQISALSKSCYSHTRELRRIRPNIDVKTASTIATSIVHSKLDYYNNHSTSISLHLSLTVFNLFKTLLSQPLNFLIIALFLNLYTG